MSETEAILTALDFQVFSVQLAFMASGPEVQQVKV